MTIRLVLLSTLGLLAAAIPTASYAGETVQLAQNRQIEVYYDEYGRRVIADAWTGEILSIERPRRGIDRRPTDSVKRYRRDRDEQYRLEDGGDDGWGGESYDRPRRGGDDDFADQPYPNEGGGLYDEEDLAAYPEEEGFRRDDAFPPAPRAPADRDGAPVTRKPLPQPGAVVREPEPEQAELQPVPEPEREAEPPLSPADPNAVPSIGSKAYLEVAELQVLLDRAGASPGVIDGRIGGNVSKALAAYDELTGQTLRTTDAPAIKAALAATGGDAFETYEITAQDAAGPYVASIPTDYGQKAQLERLSYTSTIEMLAERFHMSEGWLQQLNPDANFNRAGTMIRVTKIGRPVTGQVASIIADKGRKQVRAYDASGALLAAYPATIGSSDTPSPSGTVTVERIAVDPEYTYNPKINFKQGDNHKVLRIPPGPNGPVGAVWIALSKPTYGIHGTPDPSKIGKTESHGCVRLTNWDAQELAKLVKPGVTVEFVE